MVLLKRYCIAVIFNKTHVYYSKFNFGEINTCVFPVREMFMIQKAYLFINTT